MRSEKYIIGHGTMLRSAIANWGEIAPAEILHAVDIGPDIDHAILLNALKDVSPAQATAFVAWGAQFLNFRRLELMGELKRRGFQMPPLVCKGAILSPTTTLGENCMVGSGTILGPECRIGFNSVIGAGCILGFGVQIASSAWIADGVRIGAQARVGANATVGIGVAIDNHISIGKQSVLDLPGRRSESLPDKTFLMPAFPMAVSILDGNTA